MPEHRTIDRLLVCGGRNLTNDYWEQIEITLGELQPFKLLIEGGANGADRLARDWAVSRGIHVATVEALWENYGKAAGPIRNEAMLLLKPDLVIAFPGGAGTANMVKQAEAAGIEVRRIGW